MPKRYLIPLLLLSLVSSSFGQTTIHSNIFTNTTWSLTGSPYFIQSNLIVFENATLTIEPGVEVKVDNNLGIEFRGKLIALGNMTDSISFTSSDPAPSMGIWQGLKFTGTTNPLGVGDQATMSYCKGMYAQHFLDMDIAYHGPYRFDHCFFYKNDKVNNDGGLPKTYFNDCVFFQNNTGLSYVQFGGTAKHCSFINNINGVDGFENTDSCYFSGNTGIALSPYGSASHCIVENNNTGVSALFNAVNSNFVNNLVTGNTIGVELQSYFNGSIQFTGNCICNNSLFNIKYTWPNNADLAHNSWCLSDSAAIRQTIYDGYSPGSVSGLVNFMPFTQFCPDIDLFDMVACNGSNTMIHSIVQGNTYQWQISSGNGFANIADNSTYTGTNGKTLELHQISSEKYGNKFRCLVDSNIITPGVTIKFENRWTGAIDTSWNDPGNWLCGSIPDANTDVFIDGGWVTVQTNATCRSLYVNPSAGFKVKDGYHITISH